MKRRIAFLLSLILAIGMCGINPTYIMAADTDKVDLKYLAGKSLKETMEGLRTNDITKGAEEATFEWSIEGGAGLYELEYYTDSIKDNLNETTKVKLGFDVGTDKDGVSKPNKIKVTAELYDEATLLDNITSYQYIYPYVGQYSDPTTHGTYVTEMTRPLSSEAVANSAKELSLQIGSNLKVRAITDGKTIKVWTNQVNKGYVTDFTLSYQGVVQDTKIVFPGLKDASISSVYLENSLTDRTTPIDASGSTREQAGDRPGIKVEIERPLIRQGTTYKTMEASEAAKINASLNLMTKLEPDNILSENQIQLQFNLQGETALTGNIVNGLTKYTRLEDNNKICIYVAKSKEYVTNADGTKYLVEWSALEESMVIGAELLINGPVTIEGNEYQISTGNEALPTGYTYLQFSPEQSNVGEVTLQITPYKYKGEITYQVYVANAINSGTSGLITDETLLGEYKFTYDPLYPDRKLEISVPSGVESIFLIKADLANEASDATSQEVYYNSQSPNVIIRPYTPSIREVNDIYVISDDGATVEAAGMNLIWSAPTKEKLLETLKENNELYFELSLYDTNKENKAVIAVFKATTSGNMINVSQVGHSYADIEYDQANNQFVAKNVVLKDLETAYWEKINLPADYESGISYPDINDSLYADDMVYQIPNSFYLSMRAVLKAGGSIKASANESQYYPITLDSTSDVVPAPAGISVVKEQETTKVELNFNDVKLDAFVNYVLSPAKWILNGSTDNETFPGEYEVVLYQANYLDSANETKENEISEGSLTSYIAEGNEKIYNWSTHVTTPAAISMEGDQAALTALRNGKVVVFTLDKEHIAGAVNKMTITGLDPNQSYYVRVRTKLDSERTKGGVLETRTDYSLFSKIIGFTTITAVKPVEPDEEVPPTPKDYKAEAVDNSTAKLTWKDPDITKESGDTLSYEIIRTTEQKITESLLSRTNKASDIVSQESSKKAVLLGEADYQLVSNEDGAGYELVDNTLQPNTVYYYYIRTVYNGIYSDWIYQPVTTANIEPPISLKAFNATKTTVDISFLAKVPENLLYDTYDFGVAIQDEDGKWTTKYASSLSKLSTASTEAVPEGYNYYAYQITGLTPGKRYNIKVCVIDKTKDKIDNKYQQSLYTDIVAVRTEYDQTEQDKEDKFEEYLKRFDQEVEKYKTKPYWVVEDGTTYKYRESYLESEMGINNEYTLVKDSNASEANYYFPIDILKAINEEKTMLKIVLGDEEVYIRPNTIRADNELLQEADDLIAANRLEDYYWYVSVTKNNTSGTVNNEEIVSPKINIEMELVYMRQEDILTEADISEALTDILNNKREVFITRLENRLSGGKIDEDVLQSILEDVLADIEALHATRVSNIINRQSKNTISIGDLNQSILITHTGDHAAVNGYYYIGGSWNQVEVLTVGNGFAIEAAKLGSYIFTGQKPFIETVPGVAPYQNFINQYQLTELFTMDSYMLQVAATKGQVYGSVARMLGASKGSDYVSYLESKGIKGVSRLTANNPIRQDEAIYIIMQGYEVIKHKDVDTISIRNKQGVTNIGAFQPLYRQYVYAAVELKIITAKDSKVMPSKQMTATEIIEMLYKIK